MPESRRDVALAIRCGRAQPTTGGLDGFPIPSHHEIPLSRQMGRGGYVNIDQTSEESEDSA